MIYKNVRLDDIVLFNPHETMKKGKLAKKIDMSVLRPFTRDVPSFEISEYKGGTKFRNGDTIMARITPCLENGKTAKINILEDDEVGFGSTEYIVFRAIDGITDAEYVYYLVCSPIVREPAVKSMVGSSGRQRVQTDVLQNLKISIPDLETQRKIAAILSALDDKIELNNKINENLEQQAQAIFKSWFVDFEPFGGVMPAEWKVGKLSEIAEITMGQSPDGKSYNEEGIGTVFYQGRTDFGFRFPTRRLCTTKPNRMAKCGDALMSVRAPVGDLNVAYEECCIGRGLAAIRSKDNHQSFVLYTLFTLKNQLDVFNGEGTVFGSVNKDALNSMKIVIPPADLIDKFESIANFIDRTICNNYGETCKLQDIRDTLLPKLMNGEIDMSEVKI
ncbi:MAG: restriction endonuclease subunit S [Treponema sp.]|nr:restriction endonuclease subunit S [Treponema sp.]